VESPTSVVSSVRALSCSKGDRSLFSSCIFGVGGVDDNCRVLVLPGLGSNVGFYPDQNTAGLSRGKAMNLKPSDEGLLPFEVVRKF
jgi:hypothetical protein